MAKNFFGNGKNDSDNQAFESLSAKAINDVVLKIQNGDEELRNRFIKSFEPYIAKSASKVVGRYIDTQNSEEFGIGLSAFNEAIDKFDEMKNFIFLSFAEQVIQRRIIDYIRSNSKQNKILPFSTFEEEGKPFEENYYEDGSDDGFKEIEYREDIEKFEKALEKFGINLEELIESAPKHIDARKSSVRVARLLSENEDLYKKLNKSLNIPYKELEKAAGVSKRTLQRNSIFIIAVAIIFKYKFDVFMSYIKEFDADTALK